jgi:hypothetical protein
MPDRQFNRKGQTSSVRRQSRVATLRRQGKMMQETLNDFIGHAILNSALAASGAMP